MELFILVLAGGVPFATHPAYYGVDFVDARYPAAYVAVEVPRSVLTMNAAGEVMIADQAAIDAAILAQGAD